jgi:integrase
MNWRKPTFKPIRNKTFYKKWDRIKANNAGLDNTLRNYFLLLYWTGRRPSELLELKRQDFKEFGRKNELTGRRKYLFFESQTKKKGNPVSIYLPFEHVPKLQEFWDWIQGLPPDFLVFGALQSRSTKNIKYTLNKRVYVQVEGFGYVKTDRTIPEYREKRHETPAHRITYWSNLFFGVAPYFFRHNRFSSMAEKGMTTDDIRYFKGAKTEKSVYPYIHATGRKAKEIGDKLV